MSISSSLHSDQQVILSMSATPEFKEIGQLASKQVGTALGNFLKSGVFIYYGPTFKDQLIGEDRILKSWPNYI